jgi:hypothetical protein
VLPGKRNRVAFGVCMIPYISADCAGIAVAANTHQTDILQMHGLCAVHELHGLNVRAGTI